MIASSLLGALPDDVRARLVQLARIQDLADGERLLRQGEANDSLFIVQRGALQIRRHGTDGSPGAVIATLGPSEIVGDMSLLRGAPTSADVDAAGPTAVAVLSGDALRDDPELLAHLRAALGVIALERLDRATQDIQQRHAREIRALEMQVSATRFIVSNFVALSFYMLSLPVAQYYVTILPVSSIVSLAVIIVFFAIAVNFLRGEGGRFKEYGVTLQNWPKQLRQGLVWGLPVAVLITALKAVYLRVVGLNAPLFELSHSLDGSGLPLSIVALVCLAYIVFSFCQEVVRSGIQKALELYYAAGGVEAPVRAALATSMVFAATHAHLGLQFSLVSALASFYWSALYRKTGSYLATASNHGLLGAYIVFILGPPV